jgi:hypothetical protein
MKRGTKDVMVTVQKGGKATVDFGSGNGGLRLEGSSKELQAFLRAFGGRPLQDLAQAVRKGLKEHPGVSGSLADELF